VTDECMWCWDIAIRVRLRVVVPLLNPLVARPYVLSQPGSPWEPLLRASDVWGIVKAVKAIIV